MTTCQRHSIELNNCSYKMQGEAKSNIFRIRILTSIYHAHQVSILLLYYTKIKSKVLPSDIFLHCSVSLSEFFIKGLGQLVINWKLKPYLPCATVCDRHQYDKTNIPNWYYHISELTR